MEYLEASAKLGDKMVLLLERDKVAEEVTISVMNALELRDQLIELLEGLD